MINKIVNIMKENNNIITPSRLEKYGISRTYLSNMEKNGIIDKIERGIYVTKNYKYDEYHLFQFKYPKTVFSHNTALYFYEMTERTPINMDVSITKNYNPYLFKDFVKVHRINNDVFDLGITYKKTPLGAKVKVYNLERTVCDIIKDKDCIDVELRNKSIKKCLKSKDFNANLMFKYAKKMRIYDKVKSYMEAII